MTPDEQHSRPAAHRAGHGARGRPADRDDALTVRRRARLRRSRSRTPMQGLLRRKPRSPRCRRSLWRHRHLRRRHRPHRPLSRCPTPTASATGRCPPEPAAPARAAAPPPPPPSAPVEPQLPPTQPTVAAPPPPPPYTEPPTQPYQPPAPPVTDPRYQQQAPPPPAPVDPRYQQVPRPRRPAMTRARFVPAAAPPAPPQYPPYAVAPGGQQQPPKRGRTGLIVAGVIAIVLLLVGAAVAVVLTVSGSDKGATADSVAATSAAVTQNTVTVTKTLPSTPKSSTSKKSTTTERSSAKAQAPAVPTPNVAQRATLARAQIKAMIRGHFQKIVDGNYTSAYNDLAPSASTASESSWIQQIRDDGLYSFNVNVAPQLYSTTSGVANILNFHTEASASGCKDWSGSWSVVRSGGVWKIGKSNLSQTVVSCGE